MKKNAGDNADIQEVDALSASALLLSSVWSVAPIDDEPEIVLSNWTVFEVTSELWSESTRHFVGYNNLDREGRVSSAIVQFDPEKAIGVTRSGRVYHLQGAQGFGSPDGLYIWKFWCRRSQVTKADEVRLEAEAS